MGVGTAIGEATRPAGQGLSVCPTLLLGAGLTDRGGLAVGGLLDVEGMLRLSYKGADLGDEAVNSRRGHALLIC